MSSIRGFSLARLKKKAGTKDPTPLWFSFGTQEQIFFMKRLSMILRAGMPIMEGLRMLSDEAKSRGAKNVYGHLVLTVERGQPLSVGMMRFQNQFGVFSINIVRVGEASGTLHENLEYLAEELKRKQALRRKVVGALIYPALIVTATTGIAVMLTLYIFPKILPILTSVKSTLPLSTRMLMAISSFLGHYGWWVVGAIVLAVVAFAFSLRLKWFHRFIDLVLLRIPLLGTLSKYYNLANICRTLALLLKSGAPIVPSLELVTGSTRNIAYNEALVEAQKSVARGQKISLEFKKHPYLFPSMLTQMTVVGESTGNLSTTLEFLSGLYEEEINELTKNLTNLIEPVLMIVMGLVVGFIAVSIITPIYSITQSLTPH